MHREVAMATADSPITVEKGVDVVLVTLADERILEDHQIKTLQEALLALADENAGKAIVLSFANVKFMSSAFLGLLVRLHKRTGELGSRLQLVNLDDKIRKVFEITQLTRVFDIS